MSRIVGRTLDFFELFAREQRPLTLSEIARLMGIPVSSCHDVLSVLTERGYVIQVGTREGFYPTMKLLETGRQITEHDTSVARANVRLRQLRDDTDESVSLALATRDELRYLITLASPNNFSIRFEVGGRVRAIHATSAGLAYLGSLSPEARRETLESAAPLERLTLHTVTDIDRILADLEFAEKRGWFLNHEGSVDGVTTLSARYVSGGSLYIVTVAGPSTRVVPRMDQIAAELVAACDELSS